MRAYAADHSRSAAFLYGLGFTPGWETRGEQRGGFYVYDEAPEARGLSGGGTVHHVAWSSPMDEHEAWRDRVMSVGGQPRSIAVASPSAVPRPKVSSTTPQ